MKSLTTILRNCPNSKSAKPVSAEEIKEKESQLGLLFGPQYAAFLKEYGCLIVGANEIYGICGSNTAIPSAIHATLSARRIKSFPMNLIVIAENGQGVLFCIDSHDAVFRFERGITAPLSKNFEEFAVDWLA
jgi:hypothetical protein